MNIPPGILGEWSITAPVKAATDGGLINDTYIVGDPPSAILQRVNPIFEPPVHEDIEKITSHIEKMGMRTPRLVRTVDNQLCFPTESGTWRLLSFIEGSTVHTITNPRQAASAAALVGEFHRVTESLEHHFHFVRPGAHDTQQHMATLEEALFEPANDEVTAQAKSLGQAILETWQRWDGELELPLRICHGDLKISNIRFDQAQETAVCLLDFDTFSHQTIAVEMGDAWRSWCNPGGENNLDDVRFDLNIFEVSALAWIKNGPVLQSSERENLVLGIQRICLELSARFCADAIKKSYFKEDNRRFSVPGSHNIHRAKGQYKLAQSVQQNRQEAERIIQAS